MAGVNLGPIVHWRQARPRQLKQLSHRRSRGAAGGSTRNQCGSMEDSSLANIVGSKWRNVTNSSTKTSRVMALDGYIPRVRQTKSQRVVGQMTA